MATPAPTTNDKNKPTPGPTPSKLETKAPEPTPPAPSAPAGVASEKFPPVPGSVPVPSRAECKLALEALAKAEDELAKATFQRSKAIQTLIDAGYDSKPLKLAGKPVTFRKRMPVRAEAGALPNYFIEPYVFQEIDDLNQV